MKPHNTVTATKPHGMVIMSEDLIEDGQEWECPDCDFIAPTLEELNLLDCTKAKPELNPHAKPKDPHKSVTISEDRECKCAYCGLAAPSFEELNLLECKPGSAKPYPNPHRRLSLVPDDLGWDSREWQCDYCGKCAPHPEELVGLPSLAVPMETDPELILCTYVYPPCKNCKHGPTCWQWCRLYEPSLPPDEQPKSKLNPHNSVSRLNPELWQCDYCGIVASTMEEIDLLECTHVYPECATCKQTPLCAPKCGSYEAKSLSLADGEWPAELVAMSHEELIKECVGLGNRIADNLDLQESEVTIDRLASLAAAAYDSIGKVGDENFVKEWKRTAMEDFDIVAEKLNCGIVKNCPVPPVCTSGDWFDFIGDGINGRIGVEELFSMGFKLWAEAGDGEDDEQWLPEGGSLWLMPVNWFQELPEDVDFVHFDGLSVSKESGTAIRDHRAGYMTFGIVHIEAE